MSLACEDLRQEILALQPALRELALRLSDDEAEADDLVRITIVEALDHLGDDAGGRTETRQWLFGILRGAFHSVARRRTFQRTRGSPGRLWDPARAAAFAQPREQG
ncbi:MAG: sigma factor [Caulobacterales bacterium]